jgi:hypothetical protein
VPTRGANKKPPFKIVRKATPRALASNRSGMALSLMYCNDNKLCVVYAAFLISDPKVNENGILKYRRTLQLLDAMSMLLTR